MKVVALETPTSSSAPSRDAPRRRCDAARSRRAMPDSNDDALCNHAAALPRQPAGGNPARFGRRRPIDRDERSAQDESSRRAARRSQRVMAERAAPLLANGGAFIAVGALHLTGKDGLIERFRADGYTVARSLVRLPIPRKASRCSSLASRGAGTRGPRRGPVARPRRIQVALRLAAEAPRPACAFRASPTHQIASTPSCSASVLASARLAGDDVDDAGRHVRRVEQRIEVGRAQRMPRRRNGDHGIAHRDRRQDQRDEAEQRRLVRADDAHHAPRLVHRQRDEARLRRVHRAVVLVGEARVDRRRAGPQPRPRRAPRARMRRSRRRRSANSLAARSRFSAR